MKQRIAKKISAARWRRLCEPAPGSMANRLVEQALEQAPEPAGDPAQND